MCFGPDTGVCGIKKKKKKKKKRKAEKGKREKGAREEKTHHSFWILMTAVLPIPVHAYHKLNWFTRILGYSLVIVDINMTYFTF